uniref:Phosphoprotein n=1 Tax=Steinernema glaseri TaxID=37863 RepID=A0A1I7Z5I7_9BILA
MASSRPNQPSGPPSNPPGNPFMASFNRMMKTTSRETATAPPENVQRGASQIGRPQNAQQRNPTSLPLSTPSQPSVRPPSAPAPAPAPAPQEALMDSFKRMMLNVPKKQEGPAAPEKDQPNANQSDNAERTMIATEDLERMLQLLRELVELPTTSIGIQDECEEMIKLIEKTLKK